MRLSIECPQGHKTGQKVNVLDVDLSALLPLPDFATDGHFHIRPIILTCPAGERYRFGPADGIVVEMEMV